MWPTLLLLATPGLLLGQGTSLTLSNDRWTYGPLGAERPSHKFLPGEMLMLSFDIGGLKSDESGRVAYGIGLEVIDLKGQRLVSQEPQNLQAVNYLRGARMPSVANLQIGLDQAPGNYLLKVTVNDRTAKTMQLLERPFEVLTPNFGLVHVGTSLDLDGLVPAPAAGILGQTLYVNFAAVGFGREGAKKQPNLLVEMRVLDETGQPTTAKPLSGLANQDIADKLQLIPMQFGLTLNRTGKFTVEIKATDQVSRKTSLVTFPFTVLAAK
jgi:hypothetical protein